MLNTKFSIKKQLLPDQDFSLTTLKAILSVGLLAILISAFILKKGGGFWQVTGLSMLIALASMISGGFLGFLFGIPRHLDKSGSTTTRSFGTNTNLEQISDWLTKIIVGVSLTQLPAIERRLHNLTTVIASGFSDNMSPKYAYPYGGALITFFFVCGFLYVYLWCMLYLIEQVNGSVKSFINQAKEESAHKLELQKVKAQIASFNAKRNKIIIEESSEEFRAVVEKAKPAAVTVLDDCQKNRWGGKANSDLLEFSASFENNELDEDNSFLINLAVSFREDSAETELGPVYFFLHDTYCPGCIKQVSGNGKAVLQIASFEACTIGAYVEKFDTKLELDLNTYPASPEEYRYQDVLPTIDELRARELELEKVDNAL